MTSQTAPLFESFNARAKLPSSVARTFVPSAAFEKLAQASNSIVYGPRGSGKTTLLKMLTPTALGAWRHPKAQRVRSEISFCGVFIPYDRVWESQLSSSASIARNAAVAALVANASFCTQVFRSVVHCMQARAGHLSDGDGNAFLRVDLSSGREEKLARELGTIFELKEVPLSLAGIRRALGNRLSTVGAILARMALDGSAEDRAWERHPELALPLLPTVSAVIDAWQEVFSSDELLWGLCFDELELAPAAVKEQLLAALRSTDQRLLFKYALSPFDRGALLESRFDAAQPGQDFEPIPLWPTVKHESLAFCAELWESIQKDRGLEAHEPHRVFGRSGLRATQEFREGLYLPDTVRGRQFVELSRRDSTFRDYLEKHALDPRRLDETPPGSRDAQVRKIGPLVEARLFFLRIGEGAPSGAARSRKRLTLYAGWENLCAISEGNPRWFIGMVNDMLSEKPESSSRIPARIQALVIARAAERFLMALRTYPLSLNAGLPRMRSIGDLLDAIGTYFHQRQMLSPFSPEPPGAFTLDARTFREFNTPVGQAINAGAVLIAEDSRANGVFGPLTGVRLRLSYLLAAHYRMIPRLSREVNLTKILNAGGEMSESSENYALPI